MLHVAGCMRSYSAPCHIQVVLEGLDHVLMATGRKPNTRGLGLEEVRRHSACFALTGFVTRLASWAPSSQTPCLPRPRGGYLATTQA